MLAMCLFPRGQRMRRSETTAFLRPRKAYQNCAESFRRTCKRVVLYSSIDRPKAKIWLSIRCGIEKIAHWLVLVPTWRSLASATHILSPSGRRSMDSLGGFADQAEKVIPIGQLPHTDSHPACISMQAGVRTWEFLLHASWNIPP